MLGARRDSSREAGTSGAAQDDGYRWVALSNTTAGVFMSALDGSITIIALPAICARALPGSEYYGGSAPSRPLGRQRAQPSTARWPRTTGQTGTVPVFTAIRSSK